MKKIALFVEGETEAYFVRRLFEEVAKQDSVSFYEFKGIGGHRFPRVFSAQGQSVATNEQYVANIYICSTDNKVNQDIRDQLPTLKSSGFDVIVGLRDLRGQKSGNVDTTLADLPNYERTNMLLFASEPSVHSIIAVMEIETWFLSENTHFQRISSLLTDSVIKANVASIGIDPYLDDLTQVADPAETLDRIYNLAGEHYGKSKLLRERTINALDMAYLYISGVQRLVKLKDFVQVIDNFLS